MPKVSDAHLAARRRQITAAATRLFAERGFSRTTMADVVAASGLSTGAVYSYFPSKAELVLAVVAGRDGTVDGHLTDETPAELVSRLADYVSPGAGTAHARLVAQIWGDAAIDPTLSAVVREGHQRLQDHLADMLGQAPRRSDGDHPGAVSAQVTLATLVGLSALVAAGIPVDVDAFVRVAMGLLDPLGASLNQHPARTGPDRDRRRAPGAGSRRLEPPPDRSFTP